MIDVITSISQQFGRSLVLGALLPMSVFLALAALALGLLFPPQAGLLAAVAGIALDRWLLLVVLTIGLAGLLHNLNGPIIRFFEGYPWRNTFWGKRRTAHYRRQLEGLEQRLAEIRQQMAAGSALDDLPALHAELGRVAQRLRREYPLTGAAILPTRLGNVIRSYEHYPRRQYGMSSITLWPRLMGVVDNSYAAMISDAKIAFDFMLNSALLNGLLAVIFTLVALFPEGTRRLLQADGMANAFYLTCVLFIAVLALLSALFYRSAVGQAFAWGELVKGAFDLYRWALLARLGYTHRPQTVAEERVLWGAVSRQIIYGDPPDGEPLPYGAAAPPEDGRGAPISHVGQRAQQAE